MKQAPVVIHVDATIPICEVLEGKLRVRQIDVGQRRHRRTFKSSDGNAEAIYLPVNDRPALTARELQLEQRRR
jgi:hypothetical protein